MIAQLHFVVHTLNITFERSTLIMSSHHTVFIMQQTSRSVEVFGDNQPLHLAFVLSCQSTKVKNISEW